MGYVSLLGFIKFSSDRVSCLKKFWIFSVLVNEGHEFYGTFICPVKIFFFDSWVLTFILRFHKSFGVSVLLGLG